MPVPRRYSSALRAMLRGSRVYGSPVSGSCTKNVRFSVLCVRNGSTTAVVGSGSSSMSDSWISWKPRIDEPSNIRPSVKTSSSKDVAGTVKCCIVPGRSQNLTSTNCTFLGDEPQDLVTTGEHHPSALQGASWFRGACSEASLRRFPIRIPVFHPCYASARGKVRLRFSPAAGHLAQTGYRGGAAQSARNRRGRSGAVRCPASPATAAGPASWRGTRDARSCRPAAADKAITRASDSACPGGRGRWPACRGGGWRCSSTGCCARSIADWPWTHAQYWTLAVFAVEVYLLTALTGFTVGKRLTRIRVDPDRTAAGRLLSGRWCGPPSCSWWSRRWSPIATCAACTTGPPDTVVVRM